MIRFSGYKYSEADKIILDSLLKDEFLLSRLSTDDRYKSSPETIIRLLYNRNCRTVDDIYYALFETTLRHKDIPMKGESKFHERVYRAIINKELIVVMGDYDTDGTMGTSLMVKGLRYLGAKVVYHMNNRFVEGYGLKISTVDEIKSIYGIPSVIITVDNGIRSFEAVDYCNSLGIDVIVTDHHDPAETLPNAYAIIDPKQEGCMYPFKGLCGAGVAFKLLTSYASKFHIFDFELLGKIDSLIWIAGIATVGDRVALIDENRVIVKNTLNHLNGLYLKDNEEEHPFITCIRNVLKVDKFTEETIGFYLSPMINAMGRLEGNPLQVVEALLDNPYNKVEEIVNHMYEINKSRKDITAEEMSSALSLVGEDPSSKCLVVYVSNFSEGIVGLIASRLTEKFNRPSIVLCSSENGEVKGSARSIPGISIIDALDYVSDLLVSYGGHPPAAGLSIELGKLDEFTTRINEYMDNFDSSIFIKNVNIDLIVRESNISTRFCDLLDNLRPYGDYFPRPNIMLKDYSIDKEASIRNKSNSFYVGSNGNTLRLVGSGGLVSIGFKSADKYRSLGEPNVVNLVGLPTINEFNGYRNAQFVIDSTYILSANK